MMAATTTTATTTATNAQIKAQLYTLIHADLIASEQLHALLLEERELVIQRNREQLAFLLEKKTLVLDSIDRNADQRFALLAGQGQPTNEESWRDWIMATGDDALKLLWEQLRETLTACRHHNEVNGKMIARSRVTLGRVLNLLRGQPEYGELYNQKGHHQNYGALGTTVKA